MSVDSFQLGKQKKILSRTVRPRLANLTPEVARAILDLKLDDTDQERIRELIAKNQDNTITSEELRELEAAHHGFQGDLVSQPWRGDRA